MDRIPTAQPARIRPVRIIPRCWAAVWSTAPIKLMMAPSMIVFLRPRLSIVRPPLFTVRLHRLSMAASLTSRSRRTRPGYCQICHLGRFLRLTPENVALMAPMIFDSAFVSKKCKKWGDWMTMVITPESYPNRKLPLAANTARRTLNRRPILTGGPHEATGAEALNCKRSV